MLSPRPVGLLVSLIAATVSIMGAVMPSGASAAPAVVAKSVCAAPLPGQLGCATQVLVSKRTRTPIHPQIRPVGALGTVTQIASVGRAAPMAMTPAYLQQAYDLTYLSATQGTDDTVGVVSVNNDPNAASDLATFRSTYGLPACTTANSCFTQLNENDQTSPLPATDWSWAQEDSLDLDAVSALCPNCRIILVEANAPDSADLQAAITAAIQAGANQVSISAAGEYPADPFTGFSAPSISILAAAGDDGVAPAGYFVFPAALPYVTAVGGTSLNPDRATSPTPRGVTESAWSNSGAGCDTQEQPLAYQPATGCAGRMYSDISADANPATGLTFYDSQAGGWLDGGGTSLATPLTAAFEAVTGVDGSTPQWAYTDSSNLNDPTTGSTGTCAGTLTLLCDAGTRYDGPTGAGSISGQVVTGAPGIGEPDFGTSETPSYVRHATSTGATLLGGVYPNGQATEYYWQYGTTAAYGSRTSDLSAGSGTSPVAASGKFTHLVRGITYHYRLVASNATGTTYGYDYTLTTAGPADAKKANLANKRSTAKHHAKRHHHKHAKKRHPRHARKK
jgi:hypothetical protein